MRLALSVVAGVLSLAVVSPAAAAPPTIVDDTVTVTREDALDGYAADPTKLFQDCGDFVVLAAFTTERRRQITFEDRELVLVSFTGELFRPDTGVTVTYAGSARIEVGFGPTGPETVATTGLARYLIDLDGNRIVFDAGFFTGDFSSDPPTLIEHGLKRYEEVICGALA
ncbi:MAG: hypothetical protein ABWY81_05520 [Jiangellaceae bacterium]